MTIPQHPFESESFVDEPAIVGAVWWNTSLTTASNQRGRRAVLLAGGAALAAAGLGALVVYSPATGSSGLFSSFSDDEPYHEEGRRSLDMQREYGWNFGSPRDNLVFGEGVDVATDPLASSSDLALLATDLGPGKPALAPFYVPTLFQSLVASPKQVPPDGVTTSVPPLRTVIQPILTTEMNRAFAIGQKLAEYLAEVPEAVCVVADLPGPSAVAFAAGASDTCDVVFLFDNWPHPKGVVPAHLTLAAAVHYQRVFRANRGKRSHARHTVFVLDSARLKSYTNDATQFDNRYLARLPGGAAVSRLGFRYALHVVETDALALEEDVVAVVSTWSAQLQDTRILPLQAFEPQGTGVSFGEVATSAAFFATYPWKPGAKAAIEPLNRCTLCRAAYPKAPLVSTLPTGAAIGVVPVVLGAAGLVLGAKMLAGGSYRRTEGSSWGGG